MRSEDDSSLSPESEARSELSAGSSSSSSSSRESETTFIETVGLKTLTATGGGNNMRVKTSARMPREERQRNEKLKTKGSSESSNLGNQNITPASPASSLSGTSTFKRYKFGLTNHFLTMPDAAAAPDAAAIFVNQHQAHKSSKSAAKRRIHSKESLERNRHKTRDMERRRGTKKQPSDPISDEDDDCDLSVQAPSWRDPNSLLSHESDDWTPHEQTAAANTTGDTTTTDVAQSSSEDNDGRQHGRADRRAIGGQHRAPVAAAPNESSAERRTQLPAGDAGLDADLCNSKASAQQQQQQDSNLPTSANHNHHSQATDCYLDSEHGAYLNQHAGAPPHDDHHQSYKHLEFNDHDNGGPGAHQQYYHNSQAQQEQQEHMRRKKMKLSGEPPEDADECASNGLLVRLSSVMYATFLVILGCILHVSELRQKSRNSSDHIYTTVVALVGIFWLLFLQGDLQRYKSYARKFILLESIFNDHQNHQQRQQLAHQHEQQQQQHFRPQHQRGAQVGAGQQTTGGGGLLGLDPSARSTSSSSASLVNGDRISMNTEVIFKKTAYKMFQKQAAAPSPPPQQKQHFAGAKVTPPPPPPPPPLDQYQYSPTLVPAYKFLHGKMGANFYLKCGMAAFCFGHVIHEGLRFGQQVYFFATGNTHCRDSAALVAHLVTPLYSFYQLFMMFKYSNLVINRHKILARFGLMHIIGTCVTFWFRTILEEAFEDFVHKMDYFKAQNKPIHHYLDPTGGSQARVSDKARQQPILDSGAPANAGLAHWLGSLASLTTSESVSTGISGTAGGGQAHLFGAALNQSRAPASSGGGGGGGGSLNLTLLAQSTLLELMSSPMSATMSPQIVRHLPESYHCAQNTLLTTKSMNALPYLYPFTIEYNLLIAAIFLSLYFNIGKLGGSSGSGGSHHHHHHLANRRVPTTCYHPSPFEAASLAGGAGARSYYSPYGVNHAISQQPPGSASSSGTSFVGSQLDLALTTGGDSASSFALASSNRHLQVGDGQYHHSHLGTMHEIEDKFGVGEYKSNFVVNADCHAANKGLFLGFFVLLVTLVTIVIFFVTINKPSHLQLGIKINLIQEATLTSLILIVTLAGYRQIMRLNQNPFIRNNITTDDVLMLIPLPFFFIHSLLSIRAETATLYAPHHLAIPLQVHQHVQHHLTGSERQAVAHGDRQDEAGGASVAQLQSGRAAEAAARAQKLNDLLLDSRNGSQHQVATPRRADFMLGLPSGLNRSQRQATLVNQSSVASSNSSRVAAPFASTSTARRLEAQQEARSGPRASSKTTIDHYKLFTIILNFAVMLEVLVQTNFIIDGLRRCSESRYLRFKKPGRELITFAIILNITYWIVATFETKSVEQYKTEIDYYGPLPYMFISHTTLPVMLFYRYHSSVCLAEIWNRAYKPPKRRG